ncbi:MAG: polysaccharide deacetylase, partial [Myxococcaceae bacterium]|nr:polysaccharide deacetylase [Myxococcaceae bacterium]
ATTFAYPFSGNDDAAERIVAECGHASARDTLGISSCPKCPAAESIPPAKLVGVESTPPVQRTHTLADLQGWVMAAEGAGGGWVHIVFHKLTDDCANETYCSPPSLLRDFVAWLAPRKTLGTVVKSHHEVILGDAATPVDLPNPSLETDGDGDGAPDCCRWTARSPQAQVG